MKTQRTKLYLLLAVLLASWVPLTARATPEPTLSNAPLSNVPQPVELGGKIAHGAGEVLCYTIPHQHDAAGKIILDTPIGKIPLDVGHGPVRKGVNQLVLDTPIGKIHLDIGH